MLVAHIGEIQRIEFICKTLWDSTELFPYEIASHSASSMSSLGEWISKRGGVLGYIRSNGLDVNVISWTGLEGIVQSEKRNGPLKQQSTSGKNMYKKEIHNKTKKRSLWGRRGGWGWKVLDLSISH